MHQLLVRSLYLLVLSVLWWSCRSQAHRSEQMLEMPKPNILFIAVDDLRPELNCYGKSHIISPYLDELASQSLVFNRAYCQVPVCGASRASILTGLRPNRQQFIGYNTWVEKDTPHALSLPQHLKNNGYYTLSNGKVLHHTMDMRNSWSESPWFPDAGKNSHRNYILAENIKTSNAHKGGNGPAYEIADVDDEAYFDGQIAKKTIEDLERLAKQEQPFFLAAGFLKPHLPFNAPKKYWDLYDEDDIHFPENNYVPKDAPLVAIHNSGELRNYTNIPSEGKLSDELSRQLIHGYYACVSYTDTQIGKILKALEELGLAENTIVVLFGDHGWNLSEHTLWCKHSNFETSLRAPLMIKVPDIEGGQMTNAITEFVDIYPSLCELAGIAVPHHVEGTSFVPLLTQPAQNWKRYAVSKYHNGYTVKNDRYRYTEWWNKDGKSYAHMLYDHATDSMETINIAENPESEAIVRELQQVIFDTYPNEFTQQGR